MTAPQFEVARGVLVSLSQILGENEKEKEVLLRVINLVEQDIFKDDSPTVAINGMLAVLLNRARVLEEVERFELGK